MISNSVSDERRARILALTSTYFLPKLIKLQRKRLQTVNEKIWSSDLFDALKNLIEINDFYLHNRATEERGL